MNEWSSGSAYYSRRTTQTKKPHKVLLYRTADFGGLCRDMSDFSRLFLSPGMDSRTENVDGSWQCFKDALTSAIKKHIPTRSSKSKRGAPWITRSIKLELRRKDRRYHKARHTRKASDWTAYCKLRQHTQQLMRSAHDSYIRDVIGASLLEGGNQKRFWSYVKLNKTENMSVPILSDREGLHITDQAKSEALNRQFVSVFTQDDGKDPPDKAPPPPIR